MATMKAMKAINEEPLSVKSVPAPAVQTYGDYPQNSVAEKKQWVFCSESDTSPG